MKLNIAWARELVATRASAEYLADRLIHTSSELEDTILWPKLLESVVVGEVTTVTRHENAQRLNVLTVSTGNKNHTIVCGGTNVATGIKVALALPGAELHPQSGNCIQIKATTIRGTESAGMVCAQEELGFPPGAAGEIWILPPTATPGMPLHQYLGLTDAVLDLEITPNRPDLLSHLGLAREIAAFERKPLREPTVLSIDSSSKRLPHLVEMVVQGKETAHKAASLSFTVLPNAKTPAVAIGRLYAAGIKTVHPVVDATNYVMLELGQPLHAYDHQLLSRGSEHTTLTVTSLSKATEFTGLDGKVYQLESGDTVVMEGDRIVALGGILGGAETAIHKDTTEVTIESVCFAAPAIRRASRRLGLRSEASLRSEKGTDQELVVTALKRIAELLVLWKIAEPSSKISDTKAARHERAHISVSVQDITQQLGMNLSIPDAKHILQSLGFRTVSTTKSSLVCIPPSWRADVVQLEDCIEEIGRMWGYDRIPASPMTSSGRAPIPNNTWILTAKLRAGLVASGYSEVQLQPFVSEEALNRFSIPVSTAVRLNNPFSANAAYLSPTGMLTHLISVAADQASDTHFHFETAHRFVTKDGKPSERNTLSIIAHSDELPVTLHNDVSAAIALALQSAAIPTKLSWSNNGRTSSISDSISGLTLGEARLLSSTELQQWKIRRGKSVLCVEIDLDTLLSLGTQNHIYEPATTFPQVSRDISLALQGCSWSDLETIIHKKRPVLLQNYTLHSKAVLDKTLVVTIRCIYGTDRTLTDTEVTTAHDALIAQLQKVSGVTIR